VNLTELLSSPAAYRLGLTIIHSLWQAAAIGLAAWAVLAILRRRSPEARYAICAVALTAILVLAVGTYFVIQPPLPAVWPAAESAPSAMTAANPTVAGPKPAVSPLPVTAIPYTLPATNTTAAAVVAVPAVATEPPATVTAASPIVASAEPWAARWQRTVEPYLPLLVGVWLAGVLALSLWRTGGWIAAHRLRVIGTQSVSPALAASARRLAERLKVSRPVQIMQSLVVRTPMVIGWLRPIILLPASAVTGLATDQVEAILAHELAHIRRYDYLVNLLQVLVETIFFYHPAVWVISGRMRAERERCCDDAAVRAVGSAIRYAEALAVIETLRQPTASAVAAASGADGRDLVARVRRLLGLPEAGRSSAAASAAAAMLVLAVLTVSIAVGVSDRASASGTAAPTAAGAAEATAKPTVLTEDRKAAIVKEIEAAFTQAVKEHDKAAVELAGVKPDESVEAKNFRAWGLWIGDPIASVCLNWSDAIETLCRKLGDARTEEGGAVAPSPALAAERQVYAQAAGNWLSHKDPRYRAVACEFLSHLPVESVDAGLVPQVAALVEDKAAAFEGVTRGVAQVGTFLRRINGGVTVAMTADTALASMTTFHFADAKAFQGWWDRNKDYRGRLWYWAVRWRGVSRGTQDAAMADIETMPPREALRLMMLSCNVYAKLADAGLPPEALSGGPVVEWHRPMPAFHPGTVAAFVRRNNLKGDLLAVARQDPVWPEAKGKEALRALFLSDGFSGATITPILMQALDKEDVDVFAKEIESPHGLFTNDTIFDNMVEVAIIRDPSRAVPLVVSSLKANPDQPKLAARLVRSTGLAHWDMVEKACPVTGDRKPVISALGEYRAPETTAVLLRWLGEEDLAKADQKDPDDYRRGRLLETFAQAAAAANGGKPVIGQAAFDGIRYLGGKMGTPSELEHNKNVPQVRTEVVAELKKFFAAAAGPAAATPPAAAAASSTAAATPPAPLDDGTKWVPLEPGKVAAGSGVPPEGGELKHAVTIAFGPVTNAQYARFLKATKRPAPALPRDEPTLKKLDGAAFEKLSAGLDWKDGQPPKGHEDWPVALVSQDDARAYCRWFSHACGVQYRLPTLDEQAYAQAGAWYSAGTADMEWLGVSLGWRGLGPVGGPQRVVSKTGVQCYPMALLEWTSEKLPEGPVGDAGGENLDGGRTTLGIFMQGAGSRLEVYGFRLVLETPPAAPRLAPDLLKKRDALLAEADAKLRQGLRELNTPFPQLSVANNEPLFETLKRPTSGPGCLILWLGDGETPGKGPWNARTTPDHESWSLMVFIHPADPEDAGLQLKMGPVFANLGLSGQYHAQASNPKLAAALQKLLDDALAPLRALDREAGGAKPAVTTAEAEGKALRDTWLRERALSSPRKGEDSKAPEEYRAHAAVAQAAFDAAVKVFKKLEASEAGTPAGAQAAFWLATLYEEAGQHEACAAECRTLLEKYPDAVLDGVVSPRHQFNTYRRLGDAYAGLGKRTEAVEALARSFMAAETMRYQQSGLAHLLEYEPLIASAEFRRGLPKDVQEEIDKARKNAVILIETAAPVAVNDRTIELSYTVENRSKVRLENMRLVFSVTPTPVSPAAKPLQFGDNVTAVVTPQWHSLDPGQRRQGKATVSLDGGSRWHKPPFAIMATLERDDTALPSAAPIDELPGPLWSEGVLIEAIPAPAAAPAAANPPAPALRPGEVMVSIPVNASEFTGKLEPGTVVKVLGRFDDSDDPRQPILKTGTVFEAVRVATVMGVVRAPSPTGPTVGPVTVTDIEVILPKKEADVFAEVAKIPGPRNFLLATPKEGASPDEPKVEAPALDALRIVKSLRERNLPVYAHAAPAAAEEPSWGNADKGVRVALRPGKTKFAPGEMIRFSVDLANRGDRAISALISQQSTVWSEVEIDGAWYAWSSQITPRYAEIGSGAESRGFQLALNGPDVPWVKKDARYLPLVLPPGRHTIRVAVPCVDAKKPHDSVAAMPVSAALEFEIPAVADTDEARDEAYYRGFYEFYRDRIVHMPGLGGEQEKALATLQTEQFNQMIGGGLLYVRVTRVNAPDKMDVLINQVFSGRQVKMPIIDYAENGYPHVTRVKDTGGDYFLMETEHASAGTYPDNIYITLAVRGGLRQSLLPRSGLGPTEIMANFNIVDRGGPIAVACEALEDGGQPQAVGQEFLAQRFKVLEVLSDGNGFKEGIIHYARMAEIERPILKGEKVIWRVALAVAPTATQEAQWGGVQTLPDTPANRQAIRAQCQIAKQRGKLMAEADKAIRQGLVDLAKTYPQLAIANNRPLAEALDREKLEPNNASVYVGRSNKEAKTTWRPESIADTETWRLEVYLIVPEGLSSGWLQAAAATMSPVFPNLNLQGRYESDAGDPKLKAALQKLLDDALAPLKALDKESAPPKSEPAKAGG
jgi:beta-lactamase regulating signal transducer with metallopeptidase domain